MNLRQIGKFFKEKSRWMVVVVAFFGSIAAILSTPGMPKLFNFDHPADNASVQNKSLHTGQLTQSVSDALQENDRPNSDKLPASKPIFQATKEIYPKAPSESKPVSQSTAQKELDQPTQHCETGSFCLGLNQGTVNVNNGIQSPPKRELSIQASQLVASALPHVEARQMDMQTSGSSNESKNLASQLYSLLSAAGWKITTYNGITTAYMYADPDGQNAWTWRGIGFVCTGYIENDSTAMATISALDTSGYHCQRKPRRFGGPLASSLTLLVGSAGDMED